VSAHEVIHDVVQNKYHLASWGMVSQKIKFGDLGIPNLGDMNLCLLASWIKRY
jgi:hypothetical protein